MSATAHPTAKQKLLDAALSVIRTKGFAASSIDELCATAGVAKGSFFHHFKDKDAFGVAAADYWSQMTSGFFAAQDYHRHDDPLDRVLGYIDFRKSLITGAIPQFSCLVGTMLQEVYASAPDIGAACGASITGHCLVIEADIAQAMKHYNIHADWTAKSLSLHTQAVLQGAFILAKATGEPGRAAESVDHLRRYIECLFTDNKKGKPHEPSIFRKPAGAGCGASQGLLYGAWRQPQSAIHRRWQCLHGAGRKFLRDGDEP